MNMPKSKSASDRLQEMHTPAAIQRRLEAGPRMSYIRDFIYGAIDGAVTTFAVVSGVAGAELTAGIVVVLGLANLLGDGFSMAVGNFLGTRAEEDLKRRVRKMEEHHVRNVPEGEKEEIRQIYAKKGFDGGDLERVVEIITSDRNRWIETMLQEEWGFSALERSPWRAGISTFAAFALAGILPILPFILNLILPGGVARPFLWSAVLTGMTFFLVGAFKSIVVEESWYRAGSITLAVGGTAAVLAYTVGILLRGIL
jgi:VIT1/CCC1 family predicted Fe2+/Mn2+ transporter